MRHDLSEASAVKRFGEHKNAFGFLRLMFAALVIVSHTPELADGNRKREILTRVFGTVSFGELAVGCFFLISGYLIVGSFVSRPDARLFLLKRVARIYPAFIAASLVCVILVAPLAGASRADIVATAPRSAVLMLGLQSPDVPGVFARTPYAVLNGSMWSIAYEFRCYLLVSVLGLLGAFRRPLLVLALSVLSFAASALVPVQVWQGINSGLPFSSYWLGDLRFTSQLVGMFLAGAVFFLWRDNIRFTRVGAIAAISALTACLFVPALAFPGLALAGGYLVFGFAAWGRTGRVSRINNRDDISYGLYLYAFPLQKLLYWWWPSTPLLLSGLLTMAAAAGLGWLSWHLLEKPVMRRWTG